MGNYYYFSIRKIVRFQKNLQIHVNVGFFYKQIIYFLTKLFSDT